MATKGCCICQVAVSSGTGQETVKSHVEYPLYPVPKIPYLHKAWSAACGGELNPNSQICGKHFERGDFQRPKPPKLKTSAVPSLHLEPAIKQELGDSEIAQDEREADLSEFLQSGSEVQKSALVENLVDERDLFNAPTAITKFNRKMCGRIEYTVGDDDAFYLVCQHCAIEFYLVEWQDFLKHIKEHRTGSLVKDKSNSEPNDSLPSEFAQKEEEAETSCNVIFTDTLNSYGRNEQDSENNREVEKERKAYKENKSSCSDESDPDYDCQDEEAEDQVTAQNSRKPKSCNSLRLASNPTKTDRSSLDLTNHSLMKAFLGALKQHPILWHKRQLIKKRFDESLSQLAKTFNDKQNSNYSEQKLAASIVKLKAKMKRSSNLIQEKYSEQYEILKEIEEASKKMVCKCDNCALIFFHETDLQVHRHKIHRIGEWPFKCEICKYSFSNAETLSKHRKRHSTPKNVVCQICQKSFYEFNLEAHMETHALIICEMCGEVFTSQATYKRHKATHGPPQEKCNLCDKAFYDKRKLAFHTKQHFNQRIYNCKVCGKVFRDSRGLRVHLRNVHKITNPRPQYSWVSQEDGEYHTGEDSSEALEKIDYDAYALPQIPQALEVKLEPNTYHLGPRYPPYVS